MSAAVAFETLSDAARALKAKTISPVELTRACLDRISRDDPQVGAFITLTADRALEDAAAAERDIMAGGWRGPLHGIPIGLKDIIETKGIATTAHSRQLLHHVPTRDATVAKRLNQAGSVLLGKLACHEFSLGGPSWDLPWPPVRNPWNLARFTGGSSSGSAAAVAAGFVFGAIGSDTSGSVRSPAALCGIAGLKPSYDSIDSRGTIGLAQSLDTVGTMAWTVEDCALIYNSICRPDRTLALGNGTGWSIRGTRIRVIRHFFTDDSPISVANIRAIESALDVFRHLGCDVQEATLPPLADWMACGFVILLSEAYAAHQQWLKDRPDAYGSAFRNIVRLGATLSLSDYMDARQRRVELTAVMNTLMADCDLLVTAVQSGEAPPIEQVSPWGAFEKPSFAMPFSVTGQPALSVCCGFGDAGLPLGLQLVGRLREERTLLRVGQAYERARGWRRRLPEN